MYNLGEAMSFFFSGVAVTMVYFTAWVAFDYWREK